MSAIRTTLSSLALLAIFTATYVAACFAVTAILEGIQK